LGHRIFFKWFHLCHENLREVECYVNNVNGTASVWHFFMRMWVLLFGTLKIWLKSAFICILYVDRSLLKMNANNVVFKTNSPDHKYGTSKLTKSNIVFSFEATQEKNYSLASVLASEPFTINE